MVTHDSKDTSRTAMVTSDPKDMPCTAMVTENPKGMKHAAMATADPKDMDHAAMVTQDSKDKLYAAMVTDNPPPRMGITHTAMVTVGPRKIFAVDFGTGAALAIHGPDGPVSKKSLSLPRIKGGRTQQQEFILIAEALMRDGDVVIESPTIGSSGCEVQDVIDLLSRVNGSRLFTLSARAVKNYRQDHKLGWSKGARYAKDGAPPPVVLTLEEQKEVHGQDAKILYQIAVEQPERLYLWTGPSMEIERLHTSVRPMDKRGYRDERAERYMEMLPPYESLPQELQDILGSPKTGYSRAMVMPFAMATEEPHIDAGRREDRRSRYEKVIGLYDRGYPTFYRRATIVWMQINAKQLAGVTRIEEVDRETRKAAWKITQRQIREFFHLTMAHQGR